MARNKYPEQTVEKILQAAQKLFLEKGYDNTTIQDIVDQLGGLTKGAVYHHFKSKEEIMNAVGDRMMLENNPFEAVQQRSDLNGLEKLRLLARLNLADSARREISIQALPILQNPQVLAKIIESSRLDLAPRFLRLIEQGIADGSIQTRWSKQLAELIPLLGNLWIAPTVYPADAPEILEKFQFLVEMLDHMGLPLADQQITAEYAAFLEQISQRQKKE